MEFAHRLEQAPQPSPFVTSRPAAEPVWSHASGADPASREMPFTPNHTVDPEVLQCRLDLMSNWADEPERRPARRKPPKSSRARSGFDRLTSEEQGEGIAMKKAPSEIVLPREMTQAMQVAWNQSMPLGQAQEHGGLLVRNRDGSLKWLPAPPGQAKEMELNYDDVNPHQQILASGHTHPYSKAEHDFTDVPFSGRDLAQHVFASPGLHIVQSGEGMFGSARTKEFDEMVNALDASGQRALPKEIEQFWQSYFDSIEGSTPEKAEAATRATSEWYHLLYYAGKQGVLRRVDTSSKPEAGGK